MKLRHAEVEPLTFKALAGWSDDDHAEAFKSFLKSCGAILEGGKALRRARPVYGALFNVCERASKAGSLDRERARAFFEHNFTPLRIAPPGETEGFFTGYYEAEINGSPVKTAEYNVPLYRIPSRFLGRSKVFGQFDRAKIEDGALKGKGLEICWVKDPVDAFFAQIQGSARIKYPDGELLRLNYIASNGKPYTPVGRALIDRGIIPKEEMTMDRIRDWMEANPDEAKELRRKNRSFVFFQKTALAPHDECIGAQGVPLTPLRSLAVDRKLHVYGTPIWIDADLPLLSETPDVKFRRLMIAQDTGSAIVGAARADIYFGHGEGVASIAGRIKQHGQFVMLVPRGVIVKGDGTPGKAVPLPRPRPKTTIAERGASNALSSKSHR
ncbi:MAG TPA: MltA domain-containing protein [Pseudolabrys sp.]|nr:MltA domain-containing protein [Pseudolabrys sp.]